MKIRKSFFSVFLLVVVIAFSSGCSKTLISFFYNRVDDYVFKKVDNYFDLNDAQALMLRTQIVRLHLWHRTQELKRYAEILRYYAKSSEDNLDTTEFKNIMQRSKQRRDVLMQKVIPVTIDFLYTLDSQQIEHLEEKLQDDNEEEKNLTPQEISKKRYKTFKTVYSYLVGGLQSSQLAKLKELIKNFPSEKNIRTKEQQFIQLRQQEFIALLNEHGKNKEQLEKTLRYWMLPFEKSYPSYYQKISLQYENAMQNLLTGMDKILNDTQRQHLRKKINSLAGDLEELALSQ